jgi:hypothetical protein
MAFKLSREQLAARNALATVLRGKAETLNITIAAFNRAVEPLSRAVGEALNDYNGILETARTLSGSISETAQGEFDAKSERWQDSEKGIQVRTWIEQWEMSLDDIELELPEALEEIDPDEHADRIKDGPGSPSELEPVSERAGRRP